MEAIHLEIRTRILPVNRRFGCVCIGCGSESVLVSAEQRSGQFGTLAISGQLVARSTQIEERKIVRDENSEGLFGTRRVDGGRFSPGNGAAKSNY